MPNKNSGATNPPRPSHQFFDPLFRATSELKPFWSHQGLRSRFQPPRNRFLDSATSVCHRVGSETESDSDTSPQSCTAGSNDNIGASIPLHRCAARIRRRLRVCVRACVRVCVCACVRASMRACVRACMRACIGVRHAYVDACVCACVRACLCACVRACVCA